LPGKTAQAHFAGFGIGFALGEDFAARGRPDADGLLPVEDPGDPLAWAIISVSNHDIFRTLEIDADTGDLTVICNPWQSGSSEVTVSMTDFAGNTTEHTITFFVPPHPAPQIDVADSLALNRQTGLYEHTITVTNTGAREIAGFDLTIAGRRTLETFARPHPRRRQPRPMDRPRPAAHRHAAEQSAHALLPDQGNHRIQLTNSIMVQHRMPPPNRREHMGASSPAPNYGWRSKNGGRRRILKNPRRLCLSPTILPSGPGTAPLPYVLGKSGMTNDKFPPVIRVQISPSHRPRNTLESPRTIHRPSTMQHPRNILVLATLLPAAALAGDAKAPITPAASSGWEWSISGGPAYHSMGKLTYVGRTRSQSLALPSRVGDDVLRVPPIGEEDAVGERYYNDGYVRQDAGTSVDGNTWFWGYENASQIELPRRARVGSPEVGPTPTGDLVYHATGFQSIRNDAVTTRKAPRDSDYLRTTGIEIRADVASPWTLGSFRIGGMIGIGAVSEKQPISFRNHTTVQTRDDFRLDYTDRYALDSIIPPAAPYHGTFDGPGPLISNTPSDRTVDQVHLFTDTATFTNRVYSNFKDTAVALTMAPSLIYERGPWNFSLSGGVIVEFHSYSTRQYEVLNVAGTRFTGRQAQWAEGDSGTKIRPGLFLQLGTQYAVGNDWHIGAWARGEWADDFSVTSGPSLYQFDPVGYTFGFEIGYSF